jgi:hypothetical protein
MAADEEREGPKFRDLFGALFFVSAYRIPRAPEGKLAKRNTHARVAQLGVFLSVSVFLSRFPYSCSLSSLPAPRS